MLKGVITATVGQLSRYSRGMATTTAAFGLEKLCSSQYELNKNRMSNEHPGWISLV